MLSFFSHFIHLDVYVAERSVKSAHSVSDGKPWCKDAQIKDVVQCSVSARRAVVQGYGARDLGVAVVGVLVLPDPPCAVDLGVVEEEVWVTGRDEDITTYGSY